MTRSHKNYYLFHLLNDYSGSPMVLRQVAKTMLKNGHKVTLVTSSGRGFLSDVEGARYTHINYKWSPLKLITLFNFFFTQLRLFVYVLCLPKSSTVYVNTLLPIGASCGAFIRRFDTVYHLHEPQVQPPVLFKLLKKIAKQTAKKQIYVSNYLAHELKDIWIKDRKTIHNSVPKKYQDYLEMNVEKPSSFTVLMACSQKEYKGVYEFIDLAKSLPLLHFRLILNSKEEVFKRFLIENEIPSNCLVLPAQSDMTPHYLEASLLLNLSHTDQWIESFGLTLIEGMCFGLPVIAPDKGGPLEIVQHEVCGYLINVKNLDTIVARIKILSEDLPLYERLSKEAKSRAKGFNEERFEAELSLFLEE